MKMKTIAAGGRAIPFLALLLGAAGLPLGAQPTAITLLENKTIEQIRAFDRGFDGALGVAAIDLNTGHSFDFNGDTLFTQASVIKIPILIAMYTAQKEGQFQLTDKITLDPAEAVSGSGHLQARLKQGPVTLTIRELVTAMIVDSDNTATNKCIGMLGMDAINRTAARLGARQTRLQRKMMDSAAAKRNEENISTPREMAELVELIYRGKIVDRASSGEMLGIMKQVHGDIAAGLPLDVETACKTGRVPGARGETGIVYLEGRPFVISIMSSFIDDRRTPVPEVARIVYRYFEKLAASNRYGNRLR